MERGKLEYKMEQLLEMYGHMKRYSCYIKMRIPVENLEKGLKLKLCTTDDKGLVTVSLSYN